MKKIIIIICSICLLFLLFLYFRYDLFGKQIAVLTYHHFLSDEEIKNFDNSENYAVSESSFNQEMKYLKDNGYSTISLDQFYCWKEHKCEISKKSVLITIDDGLSSAYKYAKPILEKYNFNAVLFVIGSRVGDTTDEWDSKIYSYVGKNIIYNEDETIEIASHSYDLHHMENGKKAIELSTQKQTDNDFKMAKEILNTEYMSYPFNTYSKESFNSLKKYEYKLAFRGSNKKTYREENNYMISRIFVNDNLNDFKKIFDDNNNQSLFDKIISDIVYIKKNL